MVAEQQVRQLTHPYPKSHQVARSGQVLTMPERDTHAGSKRGLWIRDGLVSPEHCAAMGKAVWLYLHLHKHANFRTGIITGYRHTDAADELGLSLRTIKYYMDKLKRAGYVIVEQKWNCCTVTITRYKQDDGDAVRDGRRVQNPVATSTETSAKNERDECNSAYRRVQTVAPSSIFNVSLNKIQQDSTSHDVAASQTQQNTNHRLEPMPQQTTSQPVAAMPHDAYQIFAAIMAARRRDPAKAGGGTARKMLGEVQAALQIWPLSDLLGCIRWLGSDPYWRDGDLQLTIPATLNKVERWIERGRPDIWTPPRSTGNGRDRPSRPGSLDNVPEGFTFSADRRVNPGYVPTDWRSS